MRSLALVCAALPCVWGLDPSRALSQYHKRNWQVQDGLPRNYVMSVTPSGDGYLLVGTDEGLVRFDGSRFVSFDLNPELGLSRRWIGKLISARNGSLWVGTFDGWIYEYRGGHVLTRFDAGATVFELLEDGQGRIWASTRTGVMRNDGGTFRPVAGLARPPETAWNVLTLDKDGVVWAVTLDGLFRIRNDVVSRVALDRSAFGDPLAVEAGRSGTVTVGTGRGLYQWNEQAGGPVLMAVSGVPGPVVSILEDHDNVLWVGSWGQGVFRVRGRTVDSWSAREGLPDDFIRTLHEDTEGNLWIGTRGGGLVRCKDTPIVPYGIPEGLGGNYATTVAPAPDGHLWFGTWRGGLYRLGEGGFEVRPTPVPALYCSVRALAIDPDGHPWIGNWEGLFGYDGQRYRSYATAGTPYHLVSAILFDRQGRLWVATSNNGVFVFPKGDASRPEASFLPGVEIMSLLEDSRGRIWYGTPHGLGWLESKPAPWAVHVPQVPRDGVSAITEDSQGRIWATSLGGLLYVMTENRPLVVIGVKQGMPGHPLYRLVDDGAGRLWVSSAKGILRISSTQVDELLAGRRQRLDVALMDQDDGMRTPECHHVSQPAGWADARGGAWFPTTRGFVHTTSWRAGRISPPTARIEEVVWDDHLVPAGRSVRLEPGAHAMEIHFTALYFASAEEIRFRYRMDGQDANWIEAGTQRSARYGRLPPGDYRFLVSAQLPGGAWSPEAAELSIHQAPRFFQTNWFTALLFLASVAMAWGLFRWRFHIIKGRYSAVLAERNRIAREWHDTLLAGFAAITWQLEETLSRLKVKPEQAESTVELALKMVQHYRAEARSVIWDLRESRLASETLASAVSGALDQVTKGSDVSASVETEGTPVKLKDELERNVLRICQEAASNAKRHGQPKHISVRLNYGPDEIRVRIEDDGLGFVPENVMGLTRGHFGLAVMAERAERFGGRFKLTSAPGHGTIVEATIPKAAAPMK
ncbi:two-component regulator propeller domain-containing protein [uncultured Paludibaculum sp.]|uniref:sensor histidine kinase n=1 Tax=uncultured Paludibaculum sp. TaxID=1765020 RepID=UPI002AAAF25F|nr:two-component regulator propeller domain-containing protein [uncultured Paludibaculum sp.]